jgi:hypothetical protein
MRQRVLRSARAMAGNRRLPAWQRRAESTELVREAPRNASPREPHRIKPDKGGGNQFRAWTQKKRGRTSALVGSDWAVAMTMPAAAPAARTQIILEVVAGNHRSGRASAKVASWLGGATRHNSPPSFTSAVAIPGFSPFRGSPHCPCAGQLSGGQHSATTAPIAPPNSRKWQPVDVVRLCGKRIFHGDIRVRR